MIKAPSLIWATRNGNELQFVLRLRSLYRRLRVEGAYKMLFMLMSDSERIHLPEELRFFATNGLTLG